MDDRKRALSVKADPDAPPLKRQATDGSDSNGLNTRSSSVVAEVPLTQDDVALFKKEAIFRQMQAYKRERDFLQTRVNEIEQQASHNNGLLRILEAWWDQLLDEINILIGNPVSGSSSMVPKSLLLAPVNEYSNHLSSKRDRILNSLTPLFSNLAPTKSNDDNVKLKESLSEFTLQLKIAQAENERLQDERQDIERRLTDATFKFMSAEKKLDRLKSSTLAKIERSTVSAPAIKRENSTDDKAPVENGTPEVAESIVIKAQEEAEAVVHKQKEEINELQSKVISLSDAVSKLNIRLSSLSEEDLAESHTYKQLILKADELALKVTHLEGLNEILKSDNEKMNAERTEFRETVSTEYKTLMDDLQAQLKRAEEDLIRIRAARDDLLHDQNVRKLKEEQRWSAVTEATELSESRAARIASLELQVQRFKTELKLSSENSKEATSDESPEELIKRVEKLQKQNASLSSELESFESAYLQAQKQNSKRVSEVIEREDKLNRLIAEKGKAEQKYFGAMRAKEAILAENKLLKAQTVKSAEVIQQLRDAEKSVTQKVVLLEKQVAELENVRLTYQKQFHDSDRKLNENNANVDGLKAKIAKMDSELQAWSQNVQKESDLRRDAQEQVERLKIEVERRKSASVSNVNNHVNGGSQLEALRSIAICSVCSKNWKNTAIKVCGHCFCLDCAKDRLTARLRKCPLCNKQYSHNDLMTIHL
ncbi:BRE1 E3 ubiquitin ligase-domain-containing protein [Lipomyces japonicus]|uniref:BRE1 E3 ubiquitin ligase-domain-containing protein n=1 Tax=Lipomyces japonicus TaxID=56871 RepID=UPI0034CFF787